MRDVALRRFDHDRPMVTPVDDVRNRLDGAATGNWHGNLPPFFSGRGHCARLVNTSGPAFTQQVIDLIVNIV